MALCVLAAVSLIACGATPPPSPRVSPAAQAPVGVDVAAARRRGLELGFAWEPYAPESFDRARREGKLILLNGAAGWCHWCHVMDATTYRDPAVGRLLRERFVAIRVDIDERPDIADRYGEWGWPATILLTPEGAELGKLKGYMEPAQLLLALQGAGAAGAAVPDPPRRAAADRSARVGELGWVSAHALAELDDYYDDASGGWGMRQKAPLGDNLEVEARRAARGDAVARRRVLQTVAAQRALLDPVWGGVYQYSTGGGWDEPHYEKLMTYQAQNLAGYAAAFRATSDPGARADALAVARYMTTMLSGESGAFFVSQDADVGGHDERAAFVDGHDYYARSDRERRALGLPRVDESVNGFENGLAISALVDLAAATEDRAWLERARRAADAVLAAAVDERGAVWRRSRGPRSVRFAVDAASLVRALAKLGHALGDARYVGTAGRIAAVLTEDFAAPGGALHDSTLDPSAVGVFAQRRTPLSVGVLAARAFAALAVATGDVAWAVRARDALALAATPAALAAQGRMLGEFLLAADEAGVCDACAAGAPAPR